MLYGAGGRGTLIRPLRGYHGRRPVGGGERAPRGASRAARGVAMSEQTEDLERMLARERDRVIAEAGKEARDTFRELNERLTRERSRIAWRLAAVTGLAVVLGGGAGALVASGAAKRA